MEGMFSSKIAQLIERFSAQMMLFDAICADYLWIFCGKFITQIVHPKSLRTEHLHYVHFALRLQ